jgi:hypothetical protein
MMTTIQFEPSQPTNSFPSGFRLESSMRGLLSPSVSRVQVPFDPETRSYSERFCTSQHRPRQALVLMFSFNFFGWRNVNLEAVNAIDESYKGYRSREHNCCFAAQGHAQQELVRHSNSPLFFFLQYSTHVADQVPIMPSIERSFLFVRFPT